MAERTTGFHNRYRPQKLSRLIGNERVNSQLTGMVEKGKFPSAILFTGPPGAGKTTTARALVNDTLGGENIAENLLEWSFGSDRLKEDVLGLVQTMRLRPANQARRRFLIGDEAQALIGNKPAVDALLKPLEEPVPTSTYILCSMDPDKFDSNVSGRALRDRCVVFNLKLPTSEELSKYAKRIVKGEEMDYMTEEALEKVVNSARLQDGSFRVLANIMEGLSNFHAGSKKKKLSTEDVEEAIQSSQTNDDTLACDYLIGVYNRKYVAAHTAIISVEDPVGFINKVIWLNWFVHNQVLLKEARHPKVWGSKTGWILWKQVRNLMLQETKREDAIHMVGTVTQFLAAIKLSAGSFAVDERVLLSAKTFELIHQLKD